MLAVPDTVNILAMEQVISNKRDAIDHDQGKVTPKQAEKNTGIRN